MAEGKKMDAHARFDAENTKRISLKLNIRTDADILAELDKHPNKQGCIKQLIRKGMQTK